MSTWIVILLVLVGLLAVSYLLAFLYVNFHIHRWWGIRHLRVAAYTHLIMRTHAVSRTMGIPYQPTEEELQYIDEVREGKA